MMREPLPPDPREDKISDVWSRLEIQERLADRARARNAGPGLITLLVPLWIWMLGVAFLPDSIPSFARALFHASCWAGFAWLAVQAWRNQPSRDARHRRREQQALLEDIEKARRRKQLRSQEPGGPSDS